ncbi:MAG: hypothetical protein ACK4TB_15050 [Gemmobacter sp.]
MAGSGRAFNIVIVGQDGRLGYEAALFAASLRHASPAFAGRLFVAEPQPGPLWTADPRIADAALRALLRDLGATFLPFESRHFGQAYPYGNKIEALAALPPGEPFVFFDTDTLVIGDLAAVPFDFDRPAASMRREGTWPQIALYGPGYGAIWAALYDRFGLDLAGSLDLSQPDEYWQRYLYFNAGWFFHRCGPTFGARFADWAVAVRGDPGPALEGQSLDPWLDQIVLPLVIHSFGGGRPGRELDGLDGDVTCHYRVLPMLYARESDRAVEVLEAVAAPQGVKRVLKAWEPLKKFVYQRKGAKARALFDRADLPRREQVIRNTLRREGLWLR